MRWSRRVARVVAAAVTAAVLTASAGCSGPRHPTTPVVSIVLRDFHISLSPSTVPAGTVRFRVTNLGPSTHEFNLVRTPLAPSRLPIATDGISVYETGLHFAAALSEVRVGTTAVLSARVRPGHYVIYCNMPGHYLGGMRASLVVR
ncbi:MAG: sulfocyanin-like copper-binding protein [Acidimicrobiales bacterium]